MSRFVRMNLLSALLLQVACGSFGLSISLVDLLAANLPASPKSWGTGGQPGSNMSRMVDADLFPHTAILCHNAQSKSMRGQVTFKIPQLEKPVHVLFIVDEDIGRHHLGNNLWL